jgi:predicted nucleotidyltransferase
MSVAGIICEYNPFHKGHAFHIEETRSFLGEDTGIICVMSGNFVQRGEPAIMPKHARAKMAILGGADLVIELPLPWATATAERFAYGAVSILNMCGITDFISFGTECGDVERLKRVADALNSQEFDIILKSELSRGISFASARQKAAAELLSSDAELLSKPNNILGIEYLKALSRTKSEILPLAISRHATEHDGTARDGLAPASYLRELIKNGESVSEYLPETSEKILRQQLDLGTAPALLERAETAMLYRLRTMTDEEYSRLPDGSEGLWMRLMRYGRSEPTYNDVLQKTKTKRYALSRIRRMMLSALLGLSSDMTHDTPQYIRVLAFNERGRELLHDMKKCAKAPIITKPAAAKKLPEEARAIFELETRSTDIYALMLPEISNRLGGSEWTTSPIFVPRRGRNI